jgi:hypothetical protein
VVVRYGYQIKLSKAEYLLMDPFLLDLACITAYLYIHDTPPSTQEDGYVMVIAPSRRGRRVCGKTVIGGQRQTWHLSHWPWWTDRTGSG